MLTILKHRGPDSAGICINGEIKIAKEIHLLETQNLKGTVALAYNHLAVGEYENDQPLTDCSGNLILIHDGEIYNHQEIRAHLTSHKFRTISSGETIVHLIEENHSKNLTQATGASLPPLDGDYAFAVMRENEIVLARDPVGVKPLYLGDNQSFIAFASERKALWGIGIKRVRSLPPGSIASITKEKYIITKALTLPRPRIETIKAETAVLRLKEVLYSAFEKRLRGIKKLGIAFSGGLDSSLTAKIISDLGGKPALYTVGLEGSYDILTAREISSELNYELHERTLTVDEVEAYIPKVLYAVEEADVMKVSIGLPLYAATELAHKEGVPILFSGQGSDELFGGYARYLAILKYGGYRQLQNALWKDVTRIHAVNLQRDDAVAMANSVELRTPYLDIKLIKTALGLPPELKIVGLKDELRKRILRTVAGEMGLPAAIINRPKKAIQFGSGVDKAIRAITKKLGHPSTESYLKQLHSLHLC